MYIVRIKKWSLKKKPKTSHGKNDEVKMYKTPRGDLTMQVKCVFIEYLLNSVRITIFVIVCSDWL